MSMLLGKAVVNLCKSNKMLIPGKDQVLNSYQVFIVKSYPVLLHYSQGLLSKHLDSDFEICVLVTSKYMFHSVTWKKIIIENPQLKL